MAAGRGTRMLPLTESAPKPLLPNVNNCLLRHQIEFVRSHVRNLHVTIGYMADLVGKAALEFGADSVVDIGLGGNASWIQSSDLGLVDTSMIVLTCDNLMDVNLLSLLNEVEESEGSSYVVPVEKPAEYPGDRLEVRENRILAMGPSVSSMLLASGLQVLKPSVISSRAGKFDDFSEVWANLIAHEELNLSRERPKSWVAIDTPEDLVSWTIRG